MPSLGLTLFFIFISHCDGSASVKFRTTLDLECDEFLCRISKIFPLFVPIFAPYSLSIYYDIKQKRCCVLLIEGISIMKSSRGSPISIIQKIPLEVSPLVYDKRGRTKCIYVYQNTNTILVSIIYIDISMKVCILIKV